MKIEITSYGKKMAVETDHDDHTIDEVVEMFNGLLVQTGYNQNAILKSFREYAEENEE